MFNTEEKLIFVGFDKGGLQQLFRLEIRAGQAHPGVNHLRTVKTYCTSGMWDERTTLQMKAKSQRTE